MNCSAALEGKYKDWIRSDEHHKKSFMLFIAHTPSCAREKTPQNSAMKLN